MNFADALEIFFGSYPVAAAVILVGVCWIVFWVSRKITKMQDKVDSIDSLPCNEHKSTLDRHNVSIGEIREDMREIKVKVDFLVSTANSRQQRIITNSINEFSEKHSPRSLNANGIKLLDDIDGNKFIEENQDFLISEIEKFAPKTALDVENFSLSVLRINSNNDIFIPIKNWVYNSPAREIVDSDGNKAKKDINLDDVLFVLSLPLRDRYLQRHSEILP